MKETIRCGGDTDTNACIVGGLVGAAIGFNRIPSYQVGRLFQFDPTKMHTWNQSESTFRPEFLSVKHNGAELMKKVIE